MTTRLTLILGAAAYRLPSIQKLPSQNLAKQL